MISAKGRAPVSEKLYGLLLLFYPAEFRREYGPHMAQLFRDRRSETFNHLRLWSEMIIDLVRSAPREHLEKIREGVSIMRALKTIGVAIIIYAVAVLLTGIFLEKMRMQLPFFLGSLIDALVAVGILFNLIFLILWSTGLMPTARAVITSGVASALLLAIILAVISSISPVEQRPGANAIVTIFLSLCVWFIVHWMWAQKRTEREAAA